MEKLQKIINVVCKYYNLPAEQFYANSRKPNIVKAKYVYFYFARKMYRNIGLYTIGAEVGRNHATVLYGIRAINDDLDIYKSMQKEIRNLTDILEYKENQIIKKDNYTITTYFNNSFLKQY